MSEYNVTTIGSVGSWTGKQFIEGDLGVENVGISVNATDPGDESPFWHSHALLEEIYVVLDGEGELAVGDDVVPLSAGTVVRVAPDSMRALRCLRAAPSRSSGSACAPAPTPLRAPARTPRSPRRARSPGASKDQALAAFSHCSMPATCATMSAFAS